MIDAFRRRRTAAVVVVLALAMASAPAATPAGATPGGRGQRVPVAVSGPDPALTASLDAVMAASPTDSCLVVSVDGTTVYDHRGSDPQIPASTQKLLTAGATLAELGVDHRFETFLATDAPVVDGVIRGDVVLVGAGDPSLVSSIYRGFRNFSDERPVSLLDDLVGQLVEAGVSRIDGAILGDERRHDDQRVVASWPARHAAENQAGPLSALGADEGFALLPTDEGAVRVRSPLPAVTSASTLTGLLRLSGIEVGGDPWTVAPDAATPPTRLATVTSAPLEELVADMVRRSDNRSAEVLLKELGRVAEGAGSTAAGAQEVASWVEGLGVASAGSTVVDGSGLDRGNQVTCDELRRVLEVTGGAAGPLAVGLPVAGTSGTLRNRFTEDGVAGRLRAKTGALNQVTALAGFADLPDGGIATFAYIANGEWVTAEVLAAQDQLARVLTSWEPPCPSPAPPAIASPAATDLALLAAAEAGPAVAALPGVLATLDVVEGRSSDLVDRCSNEGGVSATVTSG